MITFRPEGPFNVKPTRGSSGRLIDQASADRLWRDHPDLAEGIGCYIFGVRAGRGGYVPIYVGKASTGFRHECFADHKLKHYNNALNARGACTPVMFFVVKESGPDGALDTCLDHVEHFLMQVASERNAGLANERRVDYRILGVFRTSVGPPSKASRLLRRMLGI